jgi:hypothetical protein
LLETGLDSSYKCFKDQSKDAEYKKIYKTNINDIIDYSQFEAQPFIIASMSIFFNDDTGREANYPGHAVTLIKDRFNDFYVIDDSTNIRKIEYYIAPMKHRFREVEFKDIDDESITQLKSKIDAFQNANARIYKTVIKYPKSGMTGGEQSDDDNLSSVQVTKTKKIKTWYKTKSKREKILIILTFILTMIAIIIASCKTIEYTSARSKNKKLKRKLSKTEHKIAKIEAKYNLSPYVNKARVKQHEDKIKEQQLASDKQHKSVKSNNTANNKTTCQHREQYDQVQQEPSNHQFTKQNYKVTPLNTVAGRFKNVAPEVFEIGLNVAEKYNMIDLVNKDLVKQIIKKSSNNQ